MIGTTLGAGTRIGSFEVISSLGAGGMGEVYRARDTRLDRHVALKILPASLASDPDRLMRFEREAKTLAALNHPNIAAIYGIEATALVMELVEGEDLSALIARASLESGAESGSGTPRGLSVDDVLPIARQIAEALEAAHESGIIHRDLKPANIKVRPDGTVKVLDFGLAKAMEPAGATDPSEAPLLANSPTRTSPALTAMGLILGTAAYMAPEQAKGRPVDKRADVWAFGVVLHEMLTGRRLFEAEDVSETLAAVLTRDVSAVAMSAGIPAGLRSLVSDCLVRDPRQRLRDMGDVRIALEKIGRGGNGPETIATTGAATMQAGRATGIARWLWPTLAAIGMLATVTVSTLYFLRPGIAPGEPITFEITAPDLAAPDAISPDGQYLVFATTATTAQPSKLWLRTLGSVDLRPIAGTDGVWVRGSSRPVWSPDSRALVYASGGALHRVDTVTGQSADLVTGFTSRVEGPATLLPGAWSADDVVLYGVGRINFESRNGGIWRIASAGGTPTQVTTLRPGELAQIPSGFLPDGRRFLYFAVGGHDEGGGQVRIGSLDVGLDEQIAEAIVDADGPAAYANGYLLFVSRGTLMAQRFDPDRLVLLDTPVTMVRGVAASVSASTNGRLVVRPAAAAACDPSELLNVDRTGRVIRSFGPAADYGVLNVLADGRRVAVGRQDRCASAGHIQVVDLARGAFTRLSPGTQVDSGPAGSVDDQIAYTYSPEGEGRDLYVRDASGVGDPRRLATSDSMKHANDWSPDGRFLLYDDHVAGRAQDLVLVDKAGGAPRAFLATAADETYGQFSPDGRWIAYRSNESGRNEVYVRDFAPDRTPVYGSQKVQISVNGGDKPRWNQAGTEIYFLQGAKMMAVSVQPGTPWRVGAEQALFDVRPKSFVPFDLLPDGTFIINSRAEGTGAPVPPMRVLLDWPAALRR